MPEAEGSRAQVASATTSSLSRPALAAPQKRDPRNAVARSAGKSILASSHGAPPPRPALPPGHAVSAGLADALCGYTGSPNEGIPTRPARDSSRECRRPRAQGPARMAIVAKQGNLPLAPGTVRNPFTAHSAAASDAYKCLPLDLQEA